MTPDGLPVAWAVALKQRTVAPPSAEHLAIDHHRKEEECEVEK
jgi:hypothetical protein